MPTGPRLWLRADAGVTRDAFYRASGVTDQSGQSNHLTPTDTAKRPAWIANGGNGRPTFRFDGSDDNLPFTTAISDLYSVFWVLKDNPTSGYRTFLNSSSVNTFLSDISTKIWGPFAATVVKSGETRLNGTLINGTLVNRPTQPAILSLVMTGVTTANGIGGNGPGASANAWFGDVAELILYNRTLTAAERLQVEQYLAARYGITLP